VEVLTGPEAIAQRFEYLQDTAQEQIKGFDRPPYVQGPGLNLGRARRLLRDGIRYRVIYDREAVAWPGRLDNDIRISCADGEEARVRAELPMKMIMADNRMAILPISSGNRVLDAAYVVHPCSLLEALDTLFEAEWERAVPLRTGRNEGEEDSGDLQGGPAEDHRRLLGLLAAGLTDEAIARALGWSARTTQRRLQGLMRELGATTRFQAGLAARDRGWL
jgi:hypothetical protein